MVLVQADSILWTHSFLQVLPRTSVGYFFVLLMILSNTLRQILVSMLIRKFLAGTLGDSLLPITKNKKRVQIETSSWIVEMDTLEMQSNKSNSQFLSPGSKCKPLKSSCLHKTSQALAPQAASCDSVGLPFISLQVQDRRLRRTRLLQSSEHLLAQTWSRLQLRESYGNISNECGRLWVMSKMSDYETNTICSSGNYLSHKNISLLYLPLAPKTNIGLKI